MVSFVFLREDQVSRLDQVLPTEWFIHSRVFEGICGVFSCPHLDLFATCTNPKFPLYIFGSRPDGVEAGRVSAPLVTSVCLYLPTICSALAGLVECASFDCALVGSGGAVVATERVVRRSFVPIVRQTSRTSAGVELAGPATHVEIQSRPRDPPASHVEVIQRLVRNAGFSRAFALVAAADLRRSTVALYQFKWTRCLGWCDRQGVDPCKASVPQIAEFFLYLHQEFGLSVLAVTGYRAAMNLVCSFTGMDLAAGTMVSRMFCSFERLCRL